MPDLVGIVPTIRSFTIFDQMATFSGSPFCQSINPEIGQTGFFITVYEEKTALLTIRAERLVTQS